MFIDQYREAYEVELIGKCCRSPLRVIGAMPLSGTIPIYAVPGHSGTRYWWALFNGFGTPTCKSMVPIRSGGTYSG